MNQLQEYERAVLALLGAIEANKVLQSKASSKCIRDASLHIEKLGSSLRKELILMDKALVVKQDEQ